MVLTEAKLEAFARYQAAQLELSAKAWHDVRHLTVADGGLEGLTLHSPLSTDAGSC